jgi:hypothetical protein
MKFLEKAEALAKTLEEKGDTENAEVVKKLLSEVRLGRSANRRLRRNKRSACEKMEEAGLKDIRGK